MNNSLIDTPPHVIEEDETFWTNDTAEKEIADLKKGIRSEIAKFWHSQLKTLPAKLAVNDIFKPGLARLPKVPKGKRLSRKENGERRKKEAHIKT